MTPIQTNKTVFFDREGLALNGSIYIGQPGQDPRTNAKTVTFRDSGGVEFTASQNGGLKVLLGRIVYNGKPIVSLVNGSYSMLIFDSSGQQVDYSRLIEPELNGSLAGFSEIIRVGLTLPNVKSFNVSVGDPVRNVGQFTATDGLGKDWLAVSATGSPGDDVSLIDFDNGLQGKSYQIYPYYKEESATLDGNFTGTPSVKAARIGSQVTITSQGVLLHSSLSQPSTSESPIPVWARPATDIRNVYNLSSSISRYVEITTDGKLKLEYSNTSTGALSAQSSSGLPVSISYNVF